MNKLDTIADALSDYAREIMDAAVAAATTDADDEWRSDPSAGLYDAAKVAALRIADALGVDVSGEAGPERDRRWRVHYIAARRIDNVRTGRTTREGDLTTVVVDAPHPDAARLMVNGFPHVRRVVDVFDTDTEHPLA